MSARVAAANGRAVARYRIARFLRDMLEKRPDASLNDLDTLLRDALLDGDARVEGLAKPSRAKLHRLLEPVRNAIRAGEPLTEMMFADRWGQHRPAVKHSPAVDDYMRELFLLWPGASVPKIHEEIVAFCEERHEPPPSRAAVRSARALVNVAELQASAFGRRAALSDAAQKATLPTNHPHEVWTLDEMPVPVWIKHWDVVNRKLIPVKPWIVVVTDNHTRVVVSYWIVDPKSTMHRGESATGEDVLAAFYGAALRDLAPPACQRYAGFLPQSLRMDVHKSHIAVRKLAKEHGVHVPDLPPGTPHHRGQVERLIGSLKKICFSITGHVDRFEPAAQLRDDPKAVRTRSAGRGERRARRTPLATEDLLDVHGLREAFDAQIEAYHARTHRVLQTTPEGYYATRFDPTKARSGLDAIRWLDPSVLTYGTQGIEHRDRKFIAYPDARVRPQTDDRVICYCDPGRRGIFTQMTVGKDQEWVFLAPADAVAREIHVPTFMHERAAELRDYSDRAAELYDAAADRELGGRDGWRERAAAEGRESAKEARKKRNAAAKAGNERRDAEDSKKRKAGQRKRKKPRASTGPSEPEASSEAPGTDDITRARHRHGLPAAAPPPEDEDIMPAGLTGSFGTRLE